MILDNIIMVIKSVQKRDWHFCIQRPPPTVTLKLARYLLWNVYIYLHTEDMVSICKIF